MIATGGIVNLRIGEGEVHGSVDCKLRCVYLHEQGVLRFSLQRRYRNNHACIGRKEGLHSIQGVFLALVFFMAESARS